MPARVADAPRRIARKENPRASSRKWVATACGKSPKSGPDVAFIFQAVELGSGNQRGQHGRRGGGKRRQFEQAHHGEKAERQQDQREVANPHEHRQQSHRFAQSEVDQDHQKMRQGLIDAHQGKPEGPLGAPEIQRVASVFQSGGHAGNHAKVRDVVVQVRPTRVQFGTERPGIQRQHGKQDAQGRKIFPLDLHDRCISGPRTAFRPELAAARRCESSSARQQCRRPRGGKSLH